MSTCMHYMYMCALSKCLREVLPLYGALYSEYVNICILNHTKPRTFENVCLCQARKVYRR